MTVFEKKKRQNPVNELIIYSAHLSNLVMLVNE